MFRLGIITIFLSLLAGYGPLATADIADARTSLTAGNYDDAFEQARLIGNTEALLIGAEALNTKLLLGQSAKPKKDAKKAMGIAMDILTADPTHRDAKLLYAISYGFYGRSVSPLKAWRKKMPQKIEAAIVDAVNSNPKNANSYALYAGWHLGVCAKAGRKTAKRVYGATIADGITNFEKAKSLSPNDMMINANYALMLFALDADTHHTTIEKLFLEIEKANPQNAAETYVRNLVLEIMSTRNSPKQAAKLAEGFLGW